MGRRGEDPLTAFAFAVTPLSPEFRDRLDDLAGERVELILLSDLRRLGVGALVRRLRSLRGRCFIPVEDSGAEVLLPLLELLAACSPASTIETVDATLARTSVLRSRAAIAPAWLVGASLDIRLNLLRSGRDLKQLLLAERMATAPGSERRVLHLNGNPWFGLKIGGSLTHTRGVVNGIAEAGYEVDLATASPPTDLAASVSVHRFAAPKSYGLPAEGNLYRWDRSLPGQLAALPSPSFVYQRHSLGSFAGVRLSRSLSRPLVLEYNGSEVWVARNWNRGLPLEGLARDAEEASLRHAAVVVTVSSVLRDELVARGVEASRIVMHPNGVDPDRFSPERFPAETTAALRARYGIPRDAVLATFAATFGPWHGASVLAAAIVELSSTRRAKPECPPLHFLLLGDGATLPAVRDILSPAAGAATIAGLVSEQELPLHLAASDILVSPQIANPDGTRFFGSPTKLFEYMAAGKAIVASDLGQIGDVLRGDGEPVGVLVPPGEAGPLADALIEVATDPQQRRRLGAAARRAAIERYTWRDHVQAILAGVESLRN